MKNYVFLSLSLALCGVSAQAQICLSSHKLHSLGSRHEDITTGNMNPNEDNLTDLVALRKQIGTEQGQVQIFKRSGTDGNGQPTFTMMAYNVAGSPYRLFVADFDGVNGDDVALTNNDNNTGSTITVLLNDGSGNLTPPVTYPVGLAPTGITGGHFNNDGHIDLAVASFHGQKVTILYNNGAGGFGNPQAVTTAFGNQVYFAHDVVAGDFDDDGKADIAVALATSDPYYALMTRNVQGVYAMHQPQFVGSYSIAWAKMDTADFNRDGIPDIVMATHSTAPVLAVVKARKNDLSPGFVTYACPGGARDVACGDFNGDGNPDIAVASDFGGVMGASRDSVKIILTRGDYNLSAGVQKTFALDQYFAKALTAADFNGDGKPDIAIANDNYANPDLYTLINETPYFDISGDSLFCALGSTAALAAAGNPALSYIWSVPGYTTPNPVDSFSFQANSLDNFYSVSGSAGAGCYNRSFGVVRVKPANITVDNNPDTVLTAHASNAAFQWLHCTAQGDTIIPGATGQSFTPDSSGSYRVVVTSAYGCTDTSACRSVIIPQNPNNPGNPGVGLDDAQAVKALRIYPNPASGAFTVEYPGGVRAVSVMDLTGRVVQRTNGNGAQVLALNFDAPAGVYILRIETPDGTYTQRLLSK